MSSRRADFDYPARRPARRVAPLPSPVPAPQPAPLPDWRGRALTAVETLLEALPQLAPSTVWLAGAGPGDPAHLTMMAMAGLMQADLVVHDSLIDPRLLALIPVATDRIHVGKRRGQPSWQQEAINRLLVEQAQAGRRVIRLKGGDPGIFARGGEEARALADAGIRFRIVPGLTSSLAALAMAGIPATLRGVSQALVLATGHEADARSDSLNWPALAKLDQPIAFYMGAAQAARITGRLLAAGADPETDAALIVAASLPEQHVIAGKLATIAAEASKIAGLPALLLIGRTVAARLPWGDTP